MSSFIRAVWCTLVVVVAAAVSYVLVTQTLKYMGDYFAASSREEQSRAAASPPDPYLVVLSKTAQFRVLVWTDPETDCQYLATYSAGLVLIPRTGRDGLVVCNRPVQPTQQPAQQEPTR